MLAGCSSAKNESTVASQTPTETVDKTVNESTVKSDTTDKVTFTVGFDQDFPPMGFVGDDGEFTGFDLEPRWQSVLIRKSNISQLPGMQRIWNLHQAPLIVSGTDSVLRAERTNILGQSPI